MAYSNIILSRVLAMDKIQLTEFLSTLSPDMLNYLEVLLIKAETNVPPLKKYLDSK